MPDTVGKQTQMLSFQYFSSSVAKGVGSSRCFKYTWCLTSAETIRLRRGKEVWRWGKREIIYLSLHCHHQNDFCVKVGSDDSHFNVSLIVKDKVTRQCPQTATFEVKGQPKQIRIEVPLLTSLTPYR